jgi:hypothetical protein
MRDDPERFCTFLAGLVSAAVGALPALIAANRLAPSQALGADKLPACEPLGSTADVASAFGSTFEHVADARRVPEDVRGKMLQGELRKLQAGCAEVCTWVEGPVCRASLLALAPIVHCRGLPEPTCPESHCRRGLRGGRILNDA